MSILQITILGGDLRQAYAAEYLSLCGYQITCFQTPDFPYNSNIYLGESLKQALDTQVLFLPTPFSQDGVHLFQKNSSSPPITIEKLFQQIPQHMIVFHNGIPLPLQEQLKAQDCRLYSLSDSSEFTEINAQLTAEGLLSEVIRYTPFSLQNTATLLLGYGKCGNAIGPLFSALGTRVYVLEREVTKQLQAEENGLLALSDSEKTTILPHCDLVINTIPQQVLSEQELRLLPGDCHIFDIASSPFGFSADITVEFSLPCFRLSGLPGKFHPQTAGITAGKAIERMIHHGL